MTEFLGRRGLTVNHQPKPGEIVYLRECANLSTGGTAKDVTERVHPETAAMCERAARLIGLDVCGIDLILDDIAEPAGPDNGVIEINAAPGLRMHLAPSEGRRVTAVIGVPGDRADSVVEQAGRAVAHGFRRIFIKEDRDLRGRRGGEIAELLRRAVMSEAPDRECRVVLDECDALRTALDEIHPGEVVVMFYDQLEPALALLEEFGATPAQSVPRLLYSADDYRHPGAMMAGQFAARR